MRVKGYKTKTLLGDIDEKQECEVICDAVEFGIGYSSLFLMFMGNPLMSVKLMNSLSLSLILLVNLIN